jgi:cation/acetate symporter
VVVAWVAIAAVALSASVFLALADIDVVQAAVTAFAFAAATFFPALLLTVWWKRCTWIGAMLALGFGFAAMAGALAFGDALVAGQFTSAAAALIAAAIALIAGMVGSFVGPRPSPAQLAYFEELGDPGGDALYDRALRRAAVSQ